MASTECPHCGAKLSEFTDAFCPECRYELDAPPVESSAEGRSIVKKFPMRFPMIAAGIGAGLGAFGGMAGLSQGHMGLDGSPAGWAGYVIGSSLMGFVIGGAWGMLLQRLANLTR